jgi:hypothetical protein
MFREKFDNIFEKNPYSAVFPPDMTATAENGSGIDF